MTRTDFRRMIALVLLLSVSMALFGASAHASEEVDLGLFDDALIQEMMELPKEVGEVNANGFECIYGDESMDVWTKDGYRFAITHDANGVTEVVLFATAEDDTKMFGFQRIFAGTDAEQTNTLYWTDFSDVANNYVLEEVDDELFIQSTKEFAQDPTVEKFEEIYEKLK